MASLPTTVWDQDSFVLLSLRQLLNQDCNAQYWRHPLTKQVLRIEATTLDVKESYMEPDLNQLHRKEQRKIRRLKFLASMQKKGMQYDSMSDEDDGDDDTNANDLYQYMDDTDTEIPNVQKHRIIRKKEYVITDVSGKYEWDTILYGQCHGLCQRQRQDSDSDDDRDRQRNGQCNGQCNDNDMPTTYGQLQRILNIPYSLPDGTEQSLPIQKKNGYDMNYTITRQ